MDTLTACKTAVAWVKCRTVVSTKQYSLRAAVDAAEDFYSQSCYLARPRSLDQKNTRRKEGNDMHRCNR